MLLRERDTAKGVLVSVCDEDCLGETYEDGDVSLSVTEEFYAGETATDADAEAVVDALQGATVGNLVGEESVGVAVDAGLIDEDRVLDIDGVQHAQLLWL
ncbi:MAG: hypothetical protein J07HN4v3_03103 [Halonotius sp. J07HN4]|jgi:Uncharacterized conserved protein|nr:MAG: hypothetical protein J07HN4v3_03103 [Halonotius sp. J07HN4]